MSKCKLPAATAASLPQKKCAAAAAAAHQSPTIRVVVRAAVIVLCSQFVMIATPIGRGYLAIKELEILQIAVDVVQICARLSTIEGKVNGHILK